MSHAIGIDLGTTNTVVAAVVDGVAVTLEDEQKRRLLPSVVSFHPSGTVLVGDSARERRLIDPENTIFSVKPLIGRPYDSDEVKAARGRFPFQFTEGAKNTTMVLARDVAYALPEISAFVLRRAKAIAEHALGGPVDRAVITVPANFNDLQRASTKIAGKLAGLEVLRILNEPTAAALAYGQSIAKAEKIAVYDLGGGTFDITLLDLTGNVFEVLATAGDTALGGDDIDRLLAEYISLEVMKRFNVDPRTNPVAFARLRFIAEEVKKQLSTQSSIEQEISGIGYTEGGSPMTMTMTITRQALDRIALPLIERTMSVAKQSIEIIGLHPKDFDRVILVGGSTRMPLAARLVEQLFGQSPHLKVNPDEVVALGAAIQAHALNRSKVVAKRKSGHDQLANAPHKANQNPHQIDVPRAPNVPAGMAPSSQEGVPAYIAFSKAAAVITFSPPPLPPNPNDVPDLLPFASPDNRGNRGNAAPQHGPPQGSAQGFGQGSGQGSGTGGRKPPPPVPRAGGKAIEGTPVRSALSEPPTAGPMPARRSNAPPDLHADPGGGRISLEPPGAQLGDIVAGGDFFPAFDAAPAQQPISQAAFARGSAIATSDNAPLLIDVTPMSLRIETVGGYSDVLIAANSPVPCEKTRTFLTASDNQTVVFIRVAQGDSSRFAENTRLGELELSGLKPGRRGEVKILVTFELDADGILNVRAKDKDTDRETKATMRLLGASTDDAEVDAMAARQARHAVA
jgi:molecular chaperone DnaK